MKKTSLYSTVIKCILLVGLAILPFGCEDEPEESDASKYLDENLYTSSTTTESSSSSASILVSIVNDDDDDDTSEIVTHIGQTISFRASGGSGGYVWSVGESSVGTITATWDDDSLATYVVTEVSDNTVIATDLGHGKSGTAELISGSALTLSIVPSSETITSTDLSSLHGTQIQFTGYGGTPPYTEWTVSSSELGSVDQNGLYTVNGRWGYGDNTISVRDAAGAYATATVTTQASGS